MPDPRFFDTPKAETAEVLAEPLGLAVMGNGSVTISGVAPLALAGPDDLSFVASKKHLAAAQSSQAGALVVPEDLVAQLDGRPLLVSPAPQRDFARIARRLYPSSVCADPSQGIHPSAVVAEDAVIGDGVEIGPCAVIGRGVTLGEGCKIGANVTISHADLGARVRIMPGASIGQDGFGYEAGEAGLEPIPQLGRVIIADDVDIGANTTIDRGAGGDTVIGPGTKIDNLVQIAHNCRVGAHCVITAQVGLSGSVTLGNFVQIGGQSGIAGHLTIGDGAKIAGGSGVIKDIGPGETFGGYPAVPVRSWHRQTVEISKLARPKTKG